MESIPDGASQPIAYRIAEIQLENRGRLAAGGMRFTAAHSACPVCSPTRASILTGRYPQRTGITDYINPAGANQPEGWNRNTRLLPAKYSDRLKLQWDSTIPSHALNPERVVPRAEVEKLMPASATN